MKKDDNCATAKTSNIKVSEEQIEILARRLLPEIKRVFADESIRQEFEQWQRKRQAEEAI